MATGAVSSRWEGGVSPFNVTWGKLMMWVFLVSDAFTFASFLIAYGAIRSALPEWPNPEEVFSAFPFTHAKIPLGFVSLMTFILIVSSVTMVLAVRAGHLKDRKGVIKWLSLTILGGLFFLGSQAWEWTHLIMEGMTLTSNPWGPPQFGQFFFLITGFHGSHVLSGVIINLIVLLKVIDGVYDRKGDYQIVENIGLYWHFVDLVWVFVFMAYYLISS